MYNILVCDDERDIVNALRIYLESDGYTVFEAHNGLEALSVLKSEEIHLVLLDIMMPVMDGIACTVKIREQSAVPVILLTAKSEDTDKILGLNIGADDYITKPFNPMEVNARVRSQLRRYMQLGGSVKDEGIVTIGGLRLDEKQKELTVDGDKVNLTPTEYDIISFFMRHPNEVFSPKELYRRVWNEAPMGAEGTVPVHIRHIREKIEIDPAAPRYIRAVWGQGYKLESKKENGK